MDSEDEEVGQPASNVVTPAGIELACLANMKSLVDPGLQEDE